MTDDIPYFPAFLKRLEYCVNVAGGKRKLSEKSGVSEAQIYRYLNGECNISRNKAVAIAGAVGVAPGWLMGTEERLDHLSAKDAAELKAAAENVKVAMAAFLRLLERVQAVDGD